jgi:hypothetical protein
MTIPILGQFIYLRLYAELASLWFDSTSRPANNLDASDA